MVGCREVGDKAHFLRVDAVAREDSGAIRRKGHRMHNIAGMGGLLQNGFSSTL